MAKIQVDLPPDLHKFVQHHKIDCGAANLGDAIVDIVALFTKGKNDSGGKS